MKQELSQSSNQPEPNKPVASRPPKNLYDPYKTPLFLYNALRWIAITAFALIARVHLKGRFNVPRKGPYIIAANHLSWTDIPLIPAYLPGKVIYMAKEETFEGRLGWLVRFLGAFPVKRGEGDRQAIRAAETQLKTGQVLVIFPEGTRSKTRMLNQAHAGLGMIALRSGAPVIPVAIWGSENVFKKLGAEVNITYGQPLFLKPKGKKITREEIDDATTEVMRAIAEMLPLRYRGVYTEPTAAPDTLVQPGTEASPE